MLVVNLGEAGFDEFFKFFVRGLAHSCVGRSARGKSIQAQLGVKASSYLQVILKLFQYRFE